MDGRREHHQHVRPGLPGGGTEIYIRTPEGLIYTFETDGSGGYTTDDCSIDAMYTLTSNSPYKLTDKQGNEILFDTNGMPDKYTDRNGNELDFTYNGSYQITGLTDTRGRDWSFTHNGDGFLSEIEMPCGRTWELGYDTDGNLTTIDTPTTAQQTSGITTTLTYDTSHRLTDIEDGRGNTVYEYAYVGATAQIDKVTVDGTDVD